MKTKSKFLPDLKRMGIQGLNISVGRPLTSGPTWRVCGHSEASHAVSDRPKLSTYSQIEFVAPNGGKSTFIGTDGLLNHPQIFVGYHESGFPLLLGVNRALEGHLTIIGPTRSGKSTTIGSMSFQASCLGYPTFVVGLKSIDPVLLASLKAGCESKTRLNAAGELVSAPFDYFSLQPGIRTKSFNYHAQKKTNCFRNGLMPVRSSKPLGLAEVQPTQRAATF